MTGPVLDDATIARLEPSRFCEPGTYPDLDARVRERFARIYRPLRELGAQPFHLYRAATAMFCYWPMFERIGLVSPDACVVEVGCERGMKGLAWGHLVGRYVGIDVSRQYIDSARDLQARIPDAPPLEYIVGNAAQVLRERRRFGLPDRIDVLVLYAVLEHLTQNERRDVLAAAREIFDEGGTVVIAETPNRLCRYDAHTWNMHFGNWLPPELLADYARVSQRKDVSWRLTQDTRAGLVTELSRIGLGVSYHEFGVYWRDLDVARLPARADGFALELIGFNPLHNDELDLLGYFRDNGIAVDRAFGRYWLEMILSRTGPRQAGGPVRYHPPRGPGGARLDIDRRRHWELDVVMLDTPGTRFVADLDASSTKLTLIIDVAYSAGGVVIEDAGGNVLAEIDIAVARAGRMPHWHNMATFAVDLRQHSGGPVSIRHVGVSSCLRYQGALEELALP